MDYRPNDLQDFTEDAVIPIVLVLSDHEKYHIHQTVHHISEGFLALINGPELFAFVIELNFEHIVLLVGLNEALTE